jgi:hypothetical protein
MSLKLVVVCHVEPGTMRDGDIVYGFDHTEGILRSLPRILELSDRAGVPMGFALTPQALTLCDADLSGHEVGVHLHPRDPVLVRRLGDRIHVRHDCLGRYTPEEQGALLQAARAVYEERLGRPPRLFVAGRWSEDSATAALLPKEGFTHDASALPGHRSACADWGRLPRLAQPYHPAADDHQRPGSEPLVYIPVYQSMWSDYVTPERIHALGTSFFRAALREAQVGGSDVIHFFFHSPLGLDAEALEAFGAILAYARDVIHATPVLPTTLAPSASFVARPFPPAYLAELNWRLMKNLMARTAWGRHAMGTPAGQGPPDDQGITGGDS